MMEEKVLLKIVANDYGVSTHLTVDNELELTAAVLCFYGLCLKGPDEFRKIMNKYAQEFMTGKGLKKLDEMSHVIPTDFNDLLK